MRKQAGRQAGGLNALWIAIVTIEIDVKSSSLANRLFSVPEVLLAIK